MFTIFLSEELVWAKLYLWFCLTLLFLFKFFIDFNKNFFKSRHRDSVAQNINLVQMIIKLGEETLEVLSLIIVNLESDLLRYFCQLYNLAEHSFQEWLDFFVWFFELFDHS